MELAATLATAHNTDAAGGDQRFPAALSLTLIFDRRAVKKNVGIKTPQGAPRNVRPRGPPCRRPTRRPTRQPPLAVDSGCVLADCRFKLVELVAQITGMSFTSEQVTRQGVVGGGRCCCLHRGRVRALLLSPSRRLERQLGPNLGRRRRRPLGGHWAATGPFRGGTVAAGRWGVNRNVLRTGLTYVDCHPRGHGCTGSVLLGARQRGQVFSLAAHRAHSSLPCRTVVFPLQDWKRRCLKRRPGCNCRHTAHSRHPFLRRLPSFRMLPAESCDTCVSWRASILRILRRARFAGGCPWSAARCSQHRASCTSLGIPSSPVCFIMPRRHCAPGSLRLAVA